MQRALSLRGAEQRGNLPEGQPYKSDDTMFLPVGKSDAPMARCVPLSRCGLKLSLRAEKRVPHGYIVSAGYLFSRIFRFLEKLKKAQIYFIKNREFDVFKPQKYKYLLGTPCGVLGRFLRGRVLWRT